MKNEKETTTKFRCANCHEGTEILTLGSLYSGCFHCFSRNWEEFIDGEWTPYGGRTRETDALMRHLSGV